MEMVATLPWTQHHYYKVDKRLITKIMNFGLLTKTVKKLSTIIEQWVNSTQQKAFWAEKIAHKITV